jgi:hypothetical protein
MKKKAVAKPSSKVTSNLDKQIAYSLELEAEIVKLGAEITKYHEWCNEWRRLNDGLEEELQRTQFMLMDAQAIIGYLEGKIYNS